MSCYHPSHGLFGTLSTVAEVLGTIVEETGGAAAAGHSLKPEPARQPDVENAEPVFNSDVFIHTQTTVCVVCTCSRSSMVIVYLFLDLNLTRTYLNQNI